MGINCPSQSWKAMMEGHADGATRYQDWHVCASIDRSAIPRSIDVTGRTFLSRRVRSYVTIKLLSCSQSAMISPQYYSMVSIWIHSPDFPCQIHHFQFLQLISLSSCLKSTHSSSAAFVALSPDHHCHFLCDTFGRQICYSCCSAALSSGSSDY